MTTDSRLFKKWIHSYEEDDGENVVYRPETYHFPLRRGGRDAIDLQEDKSYSKRESAHDDRYERAGGSWDMEEGNTLSLTGANEPEKMRLQIIFLSDDKLVVKKERS